MTSTTPKYNEANLKKCGPARRIKTKTTDYETITAAAIHVVAIAVVLLDVFVWRAG